MKPNRNLLYIAAAVSLIIVGIITTSIINAIKNNQAPADIRAKAGVTNTLKLTGLVDSVDETKGTVVVNNVQFAEESRSGPAHNYGTWVVTPPQGFSLFSAQSGRTVSFTVQTTSFNVAVKNVAATEMSVK